MGKFDVAKVQMPKVEFRPVEPVKPTPIKAETKTLSNPTSTAFERGGLADNLQKALTMRFLQPFVTGGDKPAPTGPPTYPNAPLFSQGAGDTNSVDYDDVSQGQQNNCFLMAGIAAIAKNNPQAIHDMVKENRDAKGNVTSYTVNLYKDGKKTEVNVHPSELLKNGANPADNGEVWVSVIEAAYAKLNGGTKVWEKGGSALSALETLTGRKGSTQSVDGKSYTFDQLQKDFNAGKNITLLTPGKEEDKKGKVAGSPYNLNNWHFYVVEKVYVDDKTGKQMVQLYNPWGSSHPKPIPFDELNKYFTQFQSN